MVLLKNAVILETLVIDCLFLFISLPYSFFLPFVHLSLYFLSSSSFSSSVDDDMLILFIYPKQRALFWSIPHSVYVIY